jgi:Right handed beta helix region
LHSARRGFRAAVILFSLGFAALNLVSCAGVVTTVPPGNAPASSPSAPAITTQPANQSVTAGQTSTFTVGAIGTAPLTYQWQKNGTALAGATTSAYTTPPTAMSDNGAQFSVVVSNSAGTVTSSSATLTVNAAVVAPTITTQPTSQSVTAGQTASFFVAATGTAPLAYQWTRNGVAISGATSPTYVTSAASTSDNGAQFTVVVSNSAGSVTSNNAILTVNAAATAPTITTQPTNQSVTAGQAASFLVAATGTAPLAYQWRRNGVAISGATSPTYVTPAASTSDNGAQFSVLVSNSAGSVTSNNAILTVNAAGVAPTITTQPTNQSVTAGQTASFFVAATGTAPLAYQWRRNGVAISGATSPTYVTPAASTSDNGAQFSVLVSNSAGSVTSNAAILTVNTGGVATDCTVFASPTGNDANSGATATSPKTFNGAANATQPGSVVCLLGGTYNLSSSFVPPVNGTPSSWIVYKAYGDSPVTLLYTGAADASPMFRLGTGNFPTGPSYLEFRGLTLNGNGNAGDAFWCEGGHHLRFIGNTMINTGGSGVGTRDCDYLTTDHNVVYHNGYMPASTPDPQWYGWTSGISYNSDQWFDNYQGFHNVISNNIVVGEYDSSTHHTDGNGIILDLSNGSYTASTANTPPALIINNVVYGNGGRCIHAFVVTNFWIVNNTCYKNNLDSTLGNAASLSTNNSQSGYFINNIAVAWDTGNPTYAEEGTNSNISFYSDLYFGSAVSFTPSSPPQFTQADPLFVNPPSLTGGGYATALAPSQLGDGLTLTSASPARGKGIDPTTLPNLPAAILSDLKNYIYTDINGKARAGGAFDSGAYQY